MFAQAVRYGVSGTHAVLEAGSVPLRTLSPGTDEKRWVDGVLAGKKGLGF